MTAETDHRIEEIRKNAYRFRDPARALAFHARCSYPMRLVNGDDGTIWIVTPADASRLERLGYDPVA